MADWAHWDDTHQFLLDGNADYVESNLAYDTYTGLEIDLLVIVTADGDVRWAEERAPDEETLLPASDELMALVAPGGPLQLTHVHDRVTGLVDVQGRLLALGVRLVSDSEGEATPNGRLAMGRWIDDDHVATLGEVLQLTARLLPASELSDDVAVTRQEVRATTALTDLSGEPVAAVEATQSRDIVREGQRSAQRLLVALLGILGIAGIGLAVSIDQLVVRRLARLDRDVASAARRRDASGRVAAAGDDEIAAVARRINDMLAALQRAQQDLELRNHELEEANAVKDDLVSVVSHELRTPLTVILGFAQTLRRDGHRLTEEQRTDFAGRLITQAQRLSRMVNDLLVVARSERGELHPVPGPVGLRDLLEEVLGDLRMHGEVTAAVDPEDLAVHVDLDHGRRILSNLLENARKYGRPPVTVRAAQDGEQAVITVEDRGEGVPDWFRPHLFDRFRQAEFGDVRRQPGVGLGLSIVRDLCRANGGDVTYVDDPEGAVFEVRLPVAAAMDPSESPRT